MAHEIADFKNQILGTDIKSNELRKIHTDDEGNLLVSSIQNRFYDSFPGTSLDSNKWDIVQTGTGMTITVSNGLLQIASGTTANQETIITSKDVFRFPFRVGFAFQASQKIANQEAYLEVISVDPATLLTDDKNKAGWKYDNTGTNSQAIYQVQNGGMTVVSSSLSTVSAWATGYAVREIVLSPDDVYFLESTIDAVTAKSNMYRKNNQIPDPNALYKLRIRIKNLGSAPATNTNYQIQFSYATDFNELIAEISSGNGYNTLAQSIPVNVANTPSVIATATPATPTPHNLTSAASTNATSIKNAAGTIFSITASNTSASSRYLKVYNKASAPTVGTDIPVLTVTLPTATEKNISFGALGHRFTTGIAVAITGAAVDTDTTAILAGEVKVCTSYT